MSEKQKNNAPRRFRWWLLVIGFVLGVVVTLLMMNVLPQNGGTSAQTDTTANRELTATALIQGATGTAHVVMTSQAQATLPAEIDPLMLTATAIVQQATQQASGS